MKRVSNIACAVLAGGKNSRMNGENKAFLIVDGAPIIGRTIRLLQGIFEEIILVTNTPQDFKGYAEKTVIMKDGIKDAGPLAGIYSALSKTTKEAVFFAACDMPYLHNGLIRKQLDYFRKTNCEAVVPKIGAFIEPLHGIYRKSLANSIRRFIENNNDYSVRGFLKTAKVSYWDIEDSNFNRRIFKNINTKEDARV